TGRHRARAETPDSWRLTHAGLIIGPRMLNRVRMLSSLRGGTAYFMTLWWEGANMNPTLTSRTQRATCSGVIPRRTPAASSRSALPLLLLRERLPCLTTLAPVTATTRLLAVETLKILAP